MLEEHVKMMHVYCVHVNSKDSFLSVLHPLFDLQILLTNWPI